LYTLKTPLKITNEKYDCEWYFVKN
jgi:hypothetical protein